MLTKKKKTLNNFKNFSHLFTFTYVNVHNVHRSSFMTRGTLREALWGYIIYIYKLKI